MITEGGCKRSARARDSGMLNAVHTAERLATLLALAAALAVFARAGDSGRHPRPGGATFEQAAASQTPRAQRSTAPSASPQPPAAPSNQRRLQTVVLDPGHGGTDEGAHGAAGVPEKDLALALALTVRKRLQQDGLHVVMTRQDDQTLPFAARAAIANAQSNAIFITLHVGSSGPVGTAFAYYYDFGQLAGPPAAAAGGLLPWDQAQRSSGALSRRLAQLLQVALSEQLPGSPELPSGAAVYQLRSIAEPAVAVEVENVNAASADKVEELGGPLAAAISRAIQAFRTVYEAEAR
jgi:N-acetylmuramoyl-L-alanine amidase